MDQILISVLTAVASFLALGVLSYIGNSLRKIKNEGSLRDIKIEALVHTIDKKFTGGTLNGENFSQCYYVQLERLMKQYNFVQPK
jgi:hypothetical protein